MREESGWRTLLSLRRLVFATGLALGCIVLGAASASADDNPLGRHSPGGPAQPAHATPERHSLSTVLKPVLGVRAPATAAVTPVAAPRSPLSTVQKPVTAVTTHVAPVLKPVSAVLKQVTPVLASVSSALVPAVASAPVTSVFDRVGALVATADRTVAPEPSSQAAAIVVKLVASGDDRARMGAGSTSTPRPATASRVAHSSSDDAGGQVRSVDISSLAPTSPGGPAAPLSQPLAVVAGAGAGPTGSSGGRGDASAAVMSGTHTSSARLLGCLPDDFWVLPRSLANDPSTSPD